MRTQGNSAIAVEGATDVTIRRVIARGGAVGLRLERAAGARVENTIVEGSMTGILLNKVQKRQPAIGISLGDRDHEAQVGLDHV